MLGVASLGWICLGDLVVVVVRFGCIAVVCVRLLLWDWCVGLGVFDARLLGFGVVYMV